MTKKDCHPSSSFPSFKSFLLPISSFPSSYSLPRYLLRFSSELKTLTYIFGLSFPLFYIPFYSYPFPLLYLTPHRFSSPTILFFTSSSFSTTRSSNFSSFFYSFPQIFRIIARPPEMESPIIKFSARAILYPDDGASVCGVFIS